MPQRGTTNRSQSTLATSRRPLKSGLDTDTKSRSRSTSKSRSTSRVRTRSQSRPRSSSRAYNTNSVCTKCGSVQNGRITNTKTRGRSHSKMNGQRYDGDKDKASEPSRVTMLTTYAITAVNQMCMFTYLGIQAFLFKQFGVDPLTFGYVQSTYAFLQLCSSPIIGRVADIFGSRSVLLLSMLSTSAAHFIMGIATNVPMLIASRASSLLMDIMPASQMVVTDVVPEKDRGRALGKIMIPMSIGMIVGPTLGGTLSKYLGGQGTLMVTFMAPLVAIFFILAFIPAQTKKSAGPRPAKKGGIDWSKLQEFLFKGDIPYLLLMRILSTLPGMIFMMNFAVAGIHYFKLSPQGNGMVVSCLGLMNMLNNWFTLGFIGKRVSNPDQLMKFAPVLSIFTYFLLSQTTEVWQLVALLFPINLSYAIMENQVMTRLTKSVPANDTSTMVGIGTALFHFSRTIAPAVGGLLMKSIGWSAIGHLGFVFSILMATLAFVKHR